MKESVEYFKHDVFQDDPLRVDFVKNQIDSSGLGKELNLPHYSKEKVDAFKHIVAETVVYTSDLTMVPGVVFRAGEGIAWDGRRYIAAAEMIEEEGQIVFSRRYLNALLSSKRPANMQDYFYTLVHPANLTAHEIKHIQQYFDNPEQVRTDFLYSAGDNTKWESTVSEGEARAFGDQYFELAVTNVKRNKRIRRAFMTFMPHSNLRIRSILRDESWNLRRII